MEKIIRSIKSQFYSVYDFMPVVIKCYVIVFRHEIYYIRFVK